MKLLILFSIFFIFTIASINAKFCTRHDGACVIKMQYSAPEKTYFPQKVPCVSDQQCDKGLKCKDKCISASHDKY